MVKKYFLKGKPLSVVRLLGKGKGGYSYLVSDGENQYVCRQIEQEPDRLCDLNDSKFKNELEAYARLRATPLNIPRLLEVNEDEEYLIKEYIEGDLISDLASCAAIETDLFLKIFKLSETLKSSGLNLDYFPTNFILRQGEIYYIDYEYNEYMDEWDFTHWGIYYWLNQEGMKFFNETGRYDLLHPDLDVSRPRSLGFENKVAKLKALYQKSQIALGLSR